MDYKIKFENLNTQFISMREKYTKVVQRAKQLEQENLTLSTTRQTKPTDHELENAELKIRVKSLMKNASDQLQIENKWLEEEISRLRQHISTSEVVAEPKQRDLFGLIEQLREENLALEAENELLRLKRRKKPRNVDIEEFKQILNDNVEDNARKVKCKAHPQLIADLQTMWNDIPNEKKEGELQELWDRKFGEWNKIPRMGKQKSSDNKFFHECDQLLDSLEGDDKLEKRRAK